MSGGGIGDALDFEKFQLGDWWDKIKENPEQLLIGAGDPISASLWSGITGKDYEPFVNVLGGPYGGGTTGLGEGGGVYERAREAGLDVSSAEGIHDAAEVIAGTMAGFYGGQAAGLWGGGAGGATAPSGGGSGFGMWGGGGAGTGAPTGGGGGLGGWGSVGGGEGGLLGGGGGGGLFDGLFGGEGGFDLGSLMQMGGGMPGGGGQQQQPQMMPMQRPGQSNFEALTVLPYQGRTPESRAAIMGMLGMPDDMTDDEMKALLGGLL